MQWINLIKSIVYGYVWVVKKQSHNCSNANLDINI